MNLEKYQSKSITPVDDYVCTLSKELQNIAIAELGETEEVRTKSIKAMRDWIMENPRIEKCRMDSKFILRFLRFRKYNLELAKEALERFLVFREGVYGHDWFSNLDITKPSIPELINKGLITVLPNRDKFGRKTIITRLAATDPSLPNIGNEALTLSVLFFETLHEDEENQICGFNYILDVSNIKLRHYFIFSFTTWYKFLKNVEKTLAARHKSFNIVNVHPTLKFVAKLALKHMPEKLRNRVSFYSNFEEIDKNGALDRKTFPVECGGEADLREIVDPWKIVLEGKKQFFLDYSKIKVNHSFYTESILNCDVEELNTPLAVLVKNSGENQEKTNRAAFIEVD